jgi:hypothetical protein
LRISAALILALPAEIGFGLSIGLCILSVVHILAC